MTQFEWNHEIGMGYLDVAPIDYDSSYFEKYQKYAMTTLGLALTRARASLVFAYWDGVGKIVDVGIGAGQFVDYLSEMGVDAHGADVCPAAIEWLKASNRHHDLAWPNGSSHADVLTFWDSLEHIPDPAGAISRARRWAFVSLPVCDTHAEWVRSKHFRPGEHLWYWSEKGFSRWAGQQGFEVIAVNRVETDLGREGISSYALKRVASPTNLGARY